MSDIFCVVNAHREGHIVRATISSVKRAVAYAESCGLKCSVLVVLDRPDRITEEVVLRESEGFADVDRVEFGDLAHSRNHAVSQSDGTYTAFVDGDDLWGKNWLIECFMAAERASKPIVLHPEYNVFFDGDFCHVFNHVDMEDHDFEIESLYRMNYWTALSFARTSTYVDHPFRKNVILEGFGYEDWTWNFETIESGITHKVARGTVHFIRKGAAQDSLLAKTNTLNALPRILDIYRQSPLKEEMCGNVQRIANHDRKSANESGISLQDEAARKDVA